MTSSFLSTSGRKHPRAPFQCQIRFSRQEMSEAGTVTDLSLGGCKVDSEASVYVGMYLALQISLPGQEATLKVDQAVVRWVKAQQYGLEFISMWPEEQERLRHFVSTLDSGPSPLSKSKGEGPTERRRAARFPVQFNLGFLRQHAVGVGSASNLSTEGCTVESELMVHQGWPLKLRFRLPDDDLPVEVTLAVVRWSQGQKFGLEFLRMKDKQRKRLRRVVSTLETEPSH